MATETTPAETLRKAAGLMRNRAEAASRGPWATSEKHGRDIAGEGFSDVRVTSAGGDIAIAYYSNLIEPYPDCENAEYMASMHPLVGLALADWLDTFEPRMEDLDFEAADWNAALKIARAYLGEN